MRRIARVFTRMAERFMPDAFIFLFALTVIVIVAGMFKGFTPLKIVDIWGEGLFGMLAFTMQATLVMITGFALAHTPPVNRVLKATARMAKNEVQIILITSTVMIICSWISFGFGLIAGAILAREMGIVHRGKIHYPLIVATTYGAFIPWHAGYGGTIPQLIATEGHFLQDMMGIIPVSQTIFSTQTLLLVAAMIIVIPITMIMMRPKNANERIDLPESVLIEEEAEASQKSDTNGNTVLSPAERWETYRVVTLILGLLGAIYLIMHFAGGGALDFNMVIMSFLAIGLLLTPNTKEYLKSFMGGSKSAYGIIIQFPFYGALSAVMLQTGIAQDITNFFVSFSTANTFPFWSFISAGFVNMFIPAAGGIWAVQGPIMINAANEIGADLSSVSMAVAWGESWTNVIQPFWALPILAIAGLRMRHIMGYTAVLLFTTGIVLGLGILLL